MHAAPFDGFGPADRIEVWLDGEPVGLPSERRTFNGIRSHLEAMALEKQRVLCGLRVDGRLLSFDQVPMESGRFYRVEGRSMEIGDRTVLIIATALEQTKRVLRRAKDAVTLVLINEGHVARELWWSLARELKEGVITLSFLPDNTCGPSLGRASLTQLRKWQLEQVASIIREVDEACASGETIRLSDALTEHVLPWLESQREHISLWRDTVIAGSCHAMGQSTAGS